jgi:hypothetical protein
MQGKGRYRASDTPRVYSAGPRYLGMLRANGKAIILGIMPGAVPTGTALPFTYPLGYPRYSPRGCHGIGPFSHAVDAIAWTVARMARVSTGPAVFGAVSKRLEYHGVTRISRPSQDFRYSHTLQINAACFSVSPISYVTRKGLSLSREHIHSACIVKYITFVLPGRVSQTI